jgi:hypothetical protein
VTDEDLKNLAGLDGLLDFDIRETAITGAGLKHVQTPSLTRFVVRGNKLTDELFDHLGGFPKLQVLSIFGDQSPSLTESRLARLAALPELQSVDLALPAMTDAGLESVGQIKTLIGFDISFANASMSKITDEGLKKLVGLSKLNKLHLWRSHCTGTGLEALVGKVPLQNILLSGNPVNAAGLAAIGKFSDLGYLALSDSPDITDEGLKSLKLPRLGIVELMNVPQVTDQGIANLAGCTSLKHLRFVSRKVSGTGFGDWAGKVPVETLDLSNEAIDAQGAAGIARLDSLKSLRCVNCPRVDDAFIERLAPLKNLEQLVLAGSGVTDASIPHLERMKSLKTLGVNNAKLTPEGLAKLKTLLPNTQFQ